MTLQQKVLECERRFRAASISTPLLDAEILVAFALGIDRSRLVAEGNKELVEKDYIRIESLASRRANREPVAYIVGKKEFYGLEFTVDHRVLIPRPETELVVETAIQYLPKGGTLLDICTGSGAIAIAIKHTRKDAAVTASDNDPAALEVAKLNADSILGEGNVQIVKSDLFSSFVGLGFDIITVNPPYVDNAIKNSLEPELQYEPEGALFPSGSSTSVIERIIENFAFILRSGGALIMEIGFDQANVVKKLCSERRYTTNFIRDLSGHDRVVVIRI